jgi:hypothetical protein
MEMLGIQSVEFPEDSFLSYIFSLFLWLCIAEPGLELLMKLLVNQYQSR